MKTSFFSKLLFLLVLLVLSELANAGITVYPIEINIGKPGSSKIEIASQSDNVSFVKIYAKKILDPGTPREKEVSIDSLDEQGLIITPLKLAITPGSSRIIRLVTLHPPQKETTWRVYIQEVSADEFNSIENDSKKKTSAEVGVNIVWGALVHVLPQKTINSIGLNLKDGEVYNKGTSRVKVLSFGQCVQNNVCTWKKNGATIYPDTHVKNFPFPFKKEMSYRIQIVDIITDKTEEIPLNIING